MRSWISPFGDLNGCVLLDEPVDPHAGGIPAAAVAGGGDVNPVAKVEARTEAWEAQSTIPPPDAAAERPDNFMMKLFTRCSSQRRFSWRNVEVPQLYPNPRPRSCREAVAAPRCGMMAAM